MDKHRLPLEMISRFIDHKLDRMPYYEITAKLEEEFGRSVCESTLVHWAQKYRPEIDEKEGRILQEIKDKFKLGKREMHRRYGREMKSTDDALDKRDYDSFEDKDLLNHKRGLMRDYAQFEGREEATKAEATAYERLMITITRPVFPEKADSDIDEHINEAVEAEWEQLPKDE